MYANSFCPAANGSRLMQKPRHLSPARQNEFFKWSQIFLAAIDRLLQLRHVFRRDLWHILELLARDRGKDPAKVEQFTLNPAEILFELLSLRVAPNHLIIHRPHHPD